MYSKMEGECKKFRV
jgi:V-type H+-transporting ATPase subunit a